MMKILFTRKDSDIICWALEEPVSHVALLVDDDNVLHITMTGVKYESLVSFLKKRRVVLRLDHYGPVDLSIADKKMVFYDYLALCYFGYRALLRKFFGLKFPDKLVYNATNAYLCTEFLIKLICKKSNKMLTPMELYNKLYKGEL
jgi:hypothetical protein